MSWVSAFKTRVLRPATPPPRPSSKARRRAGRNGLFVIAMMLAASGLLRLGQEAGSAFASGAEPPDDAHAPAAPEACGEEDIAMVLAALDQRETRLATRESDLKDRMQALVVAETQIAQNLDALQAAEQRLTATMATASTAAEEDLQRLTLVYENMKPKQAAPVFAAMDPKFAAGFLGRMRPDAAAAILAGLEPEAAYAISALLAGRNADAPTQ